MLKFYHCYSKTFYNGELMGVSDGGTMLVDDKTVHNHEVVLTWDNIEEKYQEYNGSMSFFFNLLETKKGLKVEWFDTALKDLFKKNYRSIKEWKTPDLNITTKFYYREFKPSLKRVFEWYDSEKASQYLKENNLINFSKNA